MRRCAASFALLLFCFIHAVSAAGSEYYITFRIDDRAELGKLTKIVSIDNVSDLTVVAYANDDQLYDLAAMGYTYEKLPHPGTLIQPRMATDKVDIKAWDSYPTYSGYIDMMNQFALDYPDLCEIHNIGSSVEGRALLFARISDNIGIEEDEPEVMFTATMHGDETAGYVLMLRLIDSLLTGYGTDSLITRLVDSCEIWINPLANPDGTYNGGNNSVYSATRYNANGADLNRNFPDPEDGDHPDGYSWQPETVAMMNIANDESFVISMNFHGGAEVINYPWDTWPQLHADDNWYYDISRNYADSAQYYSPSGYLTDLDNGITNGYAWYTTNGCRQDYMNYWHGCREVTGEISGTKLLSASQLPAHWTYNRVSFLNWFENALYGIRGVVTDDVTGDPVFATVTLVGHDMDSSRVFTDPDVGDYHRMVESGYYDVEFKAPGYYLKTVKGVPVSDFTGTRVDVTLTPLPNEPVLSYAGNDAGSLNPGDDVSMYITLENSGAGNATGTVADLGSTSPYITITQATASYPTITALGGTGTSLTPYEFTISPACPLYTEIAFDLYITADGGYVDTVSFTILVGEIIEGFESADFTSLPWTMSGSADWTIVSTNPYEGSYCARSGDITHYQNSQMSVTLDVATAGTISFQYKVSSEGGYDYLQFFIDGGLKDEWAGEAGWSEASFAVLPGTRTFTWKYFKDSYVTEGQDCGWIDYIVFPPITLPTPEITTTDVPDWTAGEVYSQQLEATGGVGGYTWLDTYDDLIGSGLSVSTSGILSGTPTGSTGPVTLSFTATVLDDAGGSDEQLLSFVINPQPVITTDSIPPGNIDEAYAYQLEAAMGTGTLVWSDRDGDLTGTGLTLSSSGLLSGTVDDPAILAFTARVSDAVGATTDAYFEAEFIRPYVCGDANMDGGVNVGDAIYIINFIFKGGSVPDPYEAAYTNGDELLNVGDAVYLINHIFVGGDAPICP
jgi:hypothetical protein